MVIRPPGDLNSRSDSLAWAIAAQHAHEGLETLGNETDRKD